MIKKNEPRPPKFLRLKAVLALTGVKRSTLYAWINAGFFPRQHKLGTRAVAWLEGEVTAWIQSRVQAPRSPT